MATLSRRQFFTLLTSSLWLNKASAGESASTGLMIDPRFLEHQISPSHPESPARYQAIMDHVLEAQLDQRLTLITPITDPEPWLSLVHSEQHIEQIKRHDPHAHQHALLATAGVLAAVDEVCSNRLHTAFCASRPPGHHALNTGKEEGFCYYNHIAIAARYAQKKYEFKKILIIDWDYHHGNGTEWAFYSDPSVLFFSTHDQHAYPGTGSPSRRGEGDGEGFNINVHLACGATDTDIKQVFSDLLVPAADSFKPDLILLSAGFDSHIDDPLGCHEITDQGFVELTQIVKSLAATHCDHKIISLLEGGYNIEGNASAVVAHVTALMK